MVANEDKKAVVFVPDKESEKGVLWMFLKREDCEHFALILMQLVPQFTQAHLVAKEGTIGVVLEYAQDEQREVALITPNKALEFFREYEEFLPHYYK